MVSRKPLQNHSFARKFWMTYLAVIAFVILILLLVSVGGFGYMPSLEDLKNPSSNQASELISSDQKVIGKYFVENRSNIHFEEISPNLVNALLATEDIRFREHSGVDIRAIFRVALGIVTFSNKGGGSTCLLYTSDAADE